LFDYWLVVSTYPSEKNEFVSWDDEIPNKKMRFHYSQYNYSILFPTEWKVIKVMFQAFQTDHCYPNVGAPTPPTEAAAVPRPVEPLSAMILEFTIRKIHGKSMRHVETC